VTRRWWQPTRRDAVIAALTLCGLAAAGFLVALSGVYDIAASRSHLEITRWFLEFGKRRAVATYSLPVQAPPALDDPDLVRLGAGHFRDGCAFCHGTPGERTNPIVSGMQPAPPPLSARVPVWTTEELFWIVRNGLKYTGMPAWPAPRRGDEVWAVVAFLLQLPEMDAARYRELTRLAPADTPAVAACVACHGDSSSPPVSRLVPRLNGQSQRYLELALRNYAHGQRPSGIMQPQAARLDSRSIELVARYYAGLKPASVPPADAEAGQIERGRALATGGFEERGIPPCLTCHGGHALATYPKLAGQSEAYIAGQLQLLQKGIRAGTPQGAIMTPIARLLSDRQIEDVAAYFASVEP
jgi:cytochrome c553